jgi:hypothetical protein
MIIALLEGHTPTPCCHCPSEAVAIYYLSRGCVAQPGLTVQALCAHHERKAMPRGTIELLKDLRVGRIDAAGLKETR